jgi:hypothetical protein
MCRSTPMEETMTDSNRVLEGQLRECFGRVVYSHKTHEKCADILLTHHKWIKISQIILSALVTGGILSTPLFDEWKLFVTVASATLSTALLVLNSYTKDYDLGELAQKHRRAGADLWLVREKYLSLLTDIRIGDKPREEIVAYRDKLLGELHATYTGAPSTDIKAYAAAQKALKDLGDMTFSDAEIDAFLPTELKRTPRSS